MDTETDDYSRRPAIIQIEFIEFQYNVNNVKEENITILYRWVQQIVDTIFHPSKTFSSWGDGENQLFQSIPITSLNFINVQDRFKDWYNNTYEHDENCYMTSFNDIADHPDCTCIHRPYKNSEEKWSLQKAIAIIFNAFLD